MDQHEAARPKDRVQEYEEWKQLYDEDERSPREQFRQVSNIALCMSYDLIDKMRFFEKDTLRLSDAEIAKRVPHMAAFLDHLKDAYLLFSETDL